MGQFLRHVTTEAARDLLHGDSEFLPADRLLEDLSEAQAFAQPPDSPVSIADTVAHMHFWQTRKIAVIDGDPPPYPAHEEDGWPPVLAGNWESLRTEFLAGIETCRRLAVEKIDQKVSNREDATVGFALADSALHNAYHLGQVALIRRLLGLWPPAGGDDSW